MMNYLIDEIASAWQMQDKDKVSIFVESLMDRLFIGPIVGIGAGRMGYSLRAFVMRLSHLGANASFIGDTNVPAVGHESTVIMNSSSGETPTNVLFAQQAVKNGAKLFVVTQNENSTIAKLADLVLAMPKYESSQIMKTFPEQYSYLLFDYIVSCLVDSVGLESEVITRNHSVFE